MSYDSGDSSVDLEGEEDAAVGPAGPAEERSHGDDLSVEGGVSSGEDDAGGEGETKGPGREGSPADVGEEESGSDGGGEESSEEEEVDKSENPSRRVRSAAFLESDESDAENDGAGEEVREKGEGVEGDGEESKGDEEGERGEGKGGEGEEGEREGGGGGISEPAKTGGGSGEGVSKVRLGARKFLEDSDDDEALNESQASSADAAGDEKNTSRKDSVTQEEVFGESEEEEEGEKEESGRKRRRRGSEGESEGEEGEEEEGSSVKRIREGSESGGEGGEEEIELRREVEELREGEEGEEGEDVPEVGGERVVGEVGEEGGRGEDGDPASDEEPGPSTAGMSDWDVMMQRRKEAMARARKRRKRDIDITAVDDHIMAMIREMRQAVQGDRQLNQAGQPALKKLKMLPTVILNLKKSDLQTSFIECGILTVLAEWLSPLPDRSLPHLKIREAILDILKSYPIPESHILKSSRIGKAVMLLFRHPKETRKNKEKAGKIINEWARPIFGLASDFKSLGRDEREERDYANLSQATKRRLSSSSDPKKATQEEANEPAKPGEKGWIGRARVPMPSTRDYVVRPKWTAEQEFKRGPGKKVMNRYEKQMNKDKMRKMQGKTSHAISISVEGRKMPL